MIPINSCEYLSCPVNLSNLRFISPIHCDIENHNFILSEIWTLMRLNYVKNFFYGKKLMQSQQNPLKNVAIWYCRSFNRNIALSLEITSISDCVCSLINKFSSNGRDDELTISHSTCELKKEIEMLKIKLLHELSLICSLFFILRSINLSHFFIIGCSILQYFLLNDARNFHKKSHMLPIKLKYEEQYFHIQVKCAQFTWHL